MFNKLYSYGVSEKFITLLENIKVQLSLRWPNGITNFFTLNIGPKQASNLSPILFSLFTNDINDIFGNSMCQPTKTYQLTLNNLLYADGLVLLSETCSGLQNCLEKLQQCCHKWKLKVNTKNKNNDMWKEAVSHAKFLHF